MRIRKKLNNNTIITKNERNQEIIVIGKGVGYGKSIHDTVDEKQITKIFVPENKGERKKFLDMIGQIPIEFISVSKQIISYARSEHELVLNESIYITLTDHIYSSVDRIKEGVVLKNKFQWEIKNFYPKEFEVGEKGLEIIQKETGLALDENEASFIAMHIISSEIGGVMEDFYDQTNFIQQTISIIRYYFSMDFDEESLDYFRFITHLKIFWHRIISPKNKKMQDMENDILEIIKNKRVEAYLCSLKVKQFIEKEYHYELTNEEILYLTIHISRLTQNLSVED